MSRTKADIKQHCVSLGVAAINLLSWASNNPRSQSNFADLCGKRAKEHFPELDDKDCEDISNAIWQQLAM